MRHIIKKQLINITVDHHQDVFALQQRISNVYWTRIIPVLQEFFDEVSTDTETIALHNLEIDLGILQKKDVMHNTIDGGLENELRKQLHEGILRSMYNEKEIFKTVRREIALVEQWLFYMKTGYLPWNCDNPIPDWNSQVLEALSTDYASVSQLQENILSDVNFLKRLIHQHDESFLVSLAEIITTKTQKSLLPFLNDLEKLGTGSVNKKSRFRNSIWKLLFQETSFYNSHPITIQLIFTLLEKLEKHDVIQNIKSIKQFFPSLVSVSDDVLLHFTAQYPVEKPPLKEQQTNINAPIHEKKLSRDISKKVSLLTKEVTKQFHETTANTKAPLNEEEIFFTNAGAVLLHPFLNILLTCTGRVEAGKFKSKEAQQEAVYLIHYLVTGSTSANEYELIIPKILCEVSIDEPIETDLTISESDIEESDHLLKEVISKWTVLKNTSVTGLREGFLQRKGKLSLKNEKMIVQVEAGPIDMLLDHLPWNLSIIKLPWMKNLIHVEWR